MHKKIDSSQLDVGMYIHDLSCDWMTHPFIRNRFLINKESEIRKIIDAGIRDVVIDCARGLDVVDAPTLAESRAATERALEKLAMRPVTVSRVALGDELQRADAIRQQAAAQVRNVMWDARLGRAIELSPVAPVVQSITESILRNPNALLGLQRLKTVDDYCFLHSVSVCTLMVAFCRSKGMDADTSYQAGMGGLLHDVGMAVVPDKIQNKPGPLDAEESAIAHQHAHDGHEMLRQLPELGEIPLDIVLNHHERRDGSGYPGQQAGAALSELAQMAAIVDVYDALTAETCYHKGMSEADALRKLYEWSAHHFDPRLTQEFMRCIGIYPVGTLVKLESGRLGVVVEPHATDLLTPKVNVFFNTKNNLYIKPQTVDLARKFGYGGGDRITGHESASKWNVDPMRFLSVAA